MAKPVCGRTNRDLQDSVGFGKRVTRQRDNWSRPRTTCNHDAASAQASRWNRRRNSARGQPDSATQTTQKVPASIVVPHRGTGVLEDEVPVWVDDEGRRQRVTLEFLGKLIRDIER